MQFEAKDHRNGWSNYVIFITKILQMSLGGFQAIFGSTLTHSFPIDAKCEAACQLFKSDAIL